jgi:hypothetical protein
MKPSKQQYTSFADEQRLPTLHFNNQQMPLRLKLGEYQRTYWTGLGLTAGMTLTYDLQGKYQRFTGLIGMDCITAPVGTVQLIVLADGNKKG